MPFLVKLATRNLVRNKKRTLLTFSALAVGIISLILVDSLLGGLTSQGAAKHRRLRNGGSPSPCGRILRGPENLPLSRAIDSSQVLPVVLSVDGVASAAPTTLFAARIAAGWEEFPVIGAAIDPDRVGEVFRLAGDIDGRLPRPGTSEAVIGSGL